MTLPIFSLFFRKDEPIGKKGERVAAEYLKKKGFKILEMNYKNPKGKQLGEIDIIAKKDATIIFVEVKTRKGIVENTFPEDNLTPWKLQKLEKIATHYLQTHHQGSGYGAKRYDLKRKSEPRKIKFGKIRP